MQLIFYQIHSHSILTNRFSKSNYQHYYNLTIIYYSQQEEFYIILITLFHFILQSV